MSAERPTEEVEAPFDPLTEKLYTTTEVAEMFSVTQETVRDWITNGRLKAVRLGSGHYRVTRTVLMSFANHRFASAD